MSDISNFIKPFDGKNYAGWKMRVRAYFKHKKLLEVIDKAVPEAPDQTWLDKNDEAMSYLLLFLDDNQLDYVSKKDPKIKEVFAELDENYERKSIATQLSARRALNNYKLRDSTSLDVHFKGLERLFEEYESAGGKLTKADKISYIMESMSKAYDNTIEALNVVPDEKLTTKYVKHRMYEKETQLKKESRDTSMKVLLSHSDGQSTAARGRYNYRGRGASRGLRGSFRGNFRGRGNFSRSANFKHFQKRLNQNTNLPKFASDECNFCGRKNHKAAECRYKMRHMQYQNESRGGSANLVTENKKNNEETDFTTSYFVGMAGNLQMTEFGGIEFVIDSGASHHMINDDKLFEDSINLDKPIGVQTAKAGIFINAIKRGNVRIRTQIGTAGILEDVLYCPELAKNLLSVTKLQTAGMQVTFDADCSIAIKQKGKLIMKGSLENNLPKIRCNLNVHNVRIFANLCNSKCNYNLWHKRLGHINAEKFMQLKNKNMMLDKNIIQNIQPNDKICEACIGGKQAKLASNRIKNKQHINKPLLNVHSDICGPITPSTVDNKRYFMVFLDEYTHYAVSYLANYKSDLFSIFKDFVQKSQSNFNSKIIHLYIDNGTEYLSNEMKEYCKDNGISYHLTIPYTPHQNGVAERLIRTLTEKARTLLIESQLNLKFWGEAILTATYLLNITPSRSLQGDKTPYERWHNKKPQLKFLRCFGSTVYVHKKFKESKFDKKSWKGILVGYVPNGYKIFNPETNKFVNARDVFIDEISFMSTRPILNLPNDEKSKETDDWLNIHGNKEPEGKTDDKELTDNDKSGEKNICQTIPDNNESDGGIIPGENEPEERNTEKK